MGPPYPYCAAYRGPLRQLHLADEEDTGRARDSHVHICWYVNFILRSGSGQDELGRRTMEGSKCAGEQPQNRHHRNLF
jgi:hypothetical protein